MADDKKHTEEANKILDRHINQTKIIDKYQDTIDKELENIKKLVLEETTVKLRDWHSNKETDLDSLNKIINNVDYKLSEKTTLKLKGVNVVHGLTGRYVDSIEVDYRMKFDEDPELEYKNKNSILLESIKLRSKLSKLSKK